MLSSIDAQGLVLKVSIEVPAIMISTALWALRKLIIHAVQDPRETDQDDDVGVYTPVQVSLPEGTLLQAPCDPQMAVHQQHGCTVGQERLSTSP